MFNINSATDKPDYAYLENRVRGIVENGICVNDVIDMHESALKSKEGMVDTIRSVFGIENPNSVNQIRQYLQSTGDEEIFKVCCDGIEWTTGKDAMVELANKGYEIGSAILSYRKVKNIEENLRKIRNCEVNGRIHPNFGKTKTNRVTYDNPPLMNIPKSIVWSVIGTSEPGNVLISADIKQQEPFIVANLFEIEYLKDKLYDEKGLYEALMDDIYGEVYDGIRRDEFKAAWNCLTYGGTSFALKSICKNLDYKPIQKKFKSIPEYKRYSAECKEKADMGIAATESYFGTYMDLSTSDFNKLKRVLMDAPIQGTGADITAFLVKHFDEEMQERGLSNDITLVYPRVDELVLEVSEKLVDEIGLGKVKSIIRDVLEHKVDDWVPFKLDVKEVGEKLDSSVVSLDDMEEI